MPKKEMPKMDKKNKDTVMQEIDVVELFGEDGQKMLFELIATIAEDGETYFLLTAYDEEAGSTDAPSDVFVMREAEINGEKTLESVDDRAVMEKVFDRFKKSNVDVFDFVD